jgi:hypothetical protein
MPTRRAFLTTSAMTAATHAFAANGTSDNPRALVEFGVYRGNSRIINWQELFINEQP